MMRLTKELMKASVIFFLMIVFFLPLIYAEEDMSGQTVQSTTDHPICSYLLDELGVSQGWAISGAIPYQNEVIHAYSNGQAVGSVYLVDGVIQQISCQLTGTATHIVHIQDKQTVVDIMTSGHMLDVLDEKLANKALVVQGQNLGGSMKNFFSRFVVKVGSWFN